MYIPDPLEILEARMERIMDKYVDDYTCMECGRRFDYEMNCPDPMGYGPLLCDECLEINSDGKSNNKDKR